MNKKVAIIISPNWKDYARKYLQDCIESIHSQDYKYGYKVFITDNETSAESYKFLSKTAPEAELILNKNNDGFAKGNNDAAKIALNQGFEYLFFLNMDTVIEKNCISELVKALDIDEEIGVVQARIMLYNQKDRINSIGNDTHFLGFGYCKGYREVYNSEKVKNLSPINYFSGSGFMFKADVLKEIGLFDEEYWMYNEDQDLGMRTWISGYKCALAKNAVVYHKYEFAKSIKQYYWMDRNRIITVLKFYKLGTLLFVFPVFLIMELGLILFSLKSGWFKEKKKVWKYFLSLKSWKYIIRARRETQKIRKVGDRKLAKMITGKIWYQEIDDWKLKIINPIFDIYWRLVRFIIIW